MSTMNDDTVSTMSNEKRTMPLRTFKPHFEQSYITGLRGLVVVSSFFWLFFQTFIPGLTSMDVPCPVYQEVFRKSFGVLLWNQTLIQSFFIILSARTVCASFLQEPTVNNYAGSLIRRPLRVGIPISLGLAFAIGIFSTIDTSYITEAATALDNPLLAAPEVPPTKLAGFNAIYDLLWTVRDFQTQAGNAMWPSNTMSILSIIYYQSYTVYIFMGVLPWTRHDWHWQGVLLFSLGSFWFDSWGWYSAMGMFIADLSINPRLRAHMKAGIKVGKDSHFPSWILAILTLAIGIFMKYLWNAAFPSRIRDEIALHPYVHLTDESDFNDFALDEPYARLDDFMTVTGVLLILEIWPMLQRLVANRAFVYLGQRSMSYFIAQCLLIYTVGLKLFNALHHNKGISVAGSNAVVFIVIVPVVALGAEIFHRAIDEPSRTFARAFFTWTRAY